jgi:hypothetical protein
LIEYLPILDAFRWKYGYGKCKFFKIVKIIHFESKREASGSKWQAGLGKNENLKCLTFKIELRKFYFNGMFLELPYRGVGDF